MILENLIVVKKGLFFRLDVTCFYMSAVWGAFGLCLIFGLGYLSIEDAQCLTHEQKPVSSMCLIRPIYGYIIYPHTVEGQVKPPQTKLLDRSVFHPDHPSHHVRVE